MDRELQLAADTESAAAGTRSPRAWAPPTPGPTTNREFMEMKRKDKNYMNNHEVKDRRARPGGASLP